jgi:hypothetical protein
MLIALAVALTSAGLWGGWVELTVPGMVLGGIVLAAAPMTLGRSPFDVALDFPQAGRRVEVGQTAPGELRLRNTSTRRCLPFQIRLPNGPVIHREQVPSLAAGDTYSRLIAVVGQRRGIVTVGPVESYRGDPLGLMERSIRWTESVDVCVHPPWLELRTDSPGTIRDLEGQPTSHLSDRDISFHALREYVPGDDVRNIHWLASARLANLVVKQFADTRRVRCVIVLSTAAGEYRDGDDFELAVSAFASLGRQQLVDRRTTTPFAGPHRLRHDSPAAFLDGCCLLRTVVTHSGAALAARAAIDRTPGATFAAVVTGSVPTLEEMRRVGRLLPRGIRLLTLRCGADLPEAGFRSGEASHVDLPALTRLPELLRQVARP